MKKIIVLLSTAIFLLSSSCKKTKNISINLYVGTNLSDSAEDSYPPIVLSLIKPRECESGKSNYLIDLQIHRYDSAPLETETLKIPLTGVNKTREKLNTAGFAHYSGEYADNAQDFKATKLLFEKNESPNAAAGYAAMAKKLAGGKLLVVGTPLGNLAEKALKITATVDSLELFLEEQICSGVFDEDVLHVIYNPTPTEDIEISEPGLPTPPSDIAKSIQQIGDIDTSPDERMAMIDGVLNTYFSDDADIKEFSKNGTMLGISPAREYLEKIALYKSMEKLEVKQALKKKDGKYWEVHVVEHHLHN